MAQSNDRGKAIMVDKEKRGEEDFISNLPQQILVPILSKLSLKEAGRTSVLGKRWRYRWHYVFCLQLDESLGYDIATEDAANALRASSRPLQAPESSTTRWITSVYQILLSRSRSTNSPLLFCTLAFNFHPRYALHFDRFVDYLCRNGIRYLTISNRGGGDHVYSVPMDVLSCQSLRRLALTHCRFRPPARYCLSSVTCLHLSGVHVTNLELKVIVSMCGSLDSLSLFYCSGMTNLELAAPNLTTLDVFRTWPLCLVTLDVPRLSRLMLDLWGLVHVGYDETKLFKLLKRVNHVEELNMHYTLLVTENPLGEHNVQFRMPPRLPSDCLMFKLTKLEMEISMADKGLLAILVCLINSSPNLQQLLVEDDQDGFVNPPCEEGFWEQELMPEYLARSLSVLRVEKVDLKSATVVGFVDFVLKNACALEKLEISYRGAPDVSELRHRWTSTMRWASPRAKLHIEPFVEDPD